MITSFSHINRTVRNMDESIAFYTQQLGFYVLRRYLRGEREGAYIGLGDVLFEIGVNPQMPDPAENQSGRLGLTVTDLDATVDELRAGGVEIVTEPEEMRTFNGRQSTIRDPNGYIISLREWRAPDGPHYDGWQPRHEGTVRLA